MISTAMATARGQPERHLQLATSAAGTNYGSVMPATHLAWKAAFLSGGLQYVVFRGVTVISNQLVTLVSNSVAGGYSVINGLQAVTNKLPRPPSPASSTSILAITPPTRSVSAALGLTTNDGDWPVQNGVTTPYGAANLPWSDGYASPVGVMVTNTPGQWGNPVADGMFNSYVYPWNGGNIDITVTNLANGRYDFYIYGHGAADAQCGLYQIVSGTNTYGSKSTTTTGTNSWETTNWQEGQQYVVFRDVWVTTNNQRGHRPQGFLNVTPSATAPGEIALLPQPSDDTDSDGDGIPIGGKLRMA